MYRLLIAILAFGLLFGGATTICGLDDGERRPLDLPSGGTGDGEEDEDAPEVISFYGAEFEADAFFWVIDRSGSMLGEPMAVLQFELTEGLRQLTNRAEFGMVSFATEYTIFEPRPMRATTSNKARGAIWVNALMADGWTCMPDPAAEIFNIANQSRKRNRVVILVGDGVPRCMTFENIESDEVLEAIAAANHKRTKVNTIFIAGDPASQTEGINLYTEIAHRNRGTIIIVEK